MIFVIILRYIWNFIYDVNAYKLNIEGRFNNFYCIFFNIYIYIDNLSTVFDVV